MFTMGANKDWNKFKRIWEGRIDTAELTDTDDWGGSDNARRKIRTRFGHKKHNRGMANSFGSEFGG